MKIAVCLVSAQPIPNVLFLKECSGFIDSILFISTEAMEKTPKTQFIQEGSGCMTIPQEVIVVKEYDLEDIIIKISQNIIKENQYYVNLTCGTKLMFLATFQVFSKCKSEIFYHGLATDSFDRLYSYQPKDFEPLEIKKNLSLEEFFSSFGMAIKSSVPKFSNELRTKMFQIFWDHQQEIKLLRALRNYKTVKNKLGKKKEIDLVKAYENFTENNFPVEGTDITKLTAFINAFGFSSDNLGRDEIGFIIGGWFEEYLYSFLESLHCQCAISTVVKSKIPISDHIENEFDVLLLDNRKLYVIECKSTVDNTLLLETLYKQSALQKNFGLRVSSILVTMTKSDSIRSWDKLTNRAESMGITIIDGLMLENMTAESFYHKITTGKAP